MFENKKIFILGFAKSGYEAAKILIKNNDVLINDFKELKEEDKRNYEELKALGVNFYFGGHPDDLLDSSFDYLIKNPGIAIDHKYVLKAKELNIPVINEVEVAYRLIPKNKNIKIIGITGTNGKTTTTTLIYEFLKEDKKSVHLAGNIGYPLCSILNKLQENDIIVTEVSCQQLENLVDFTPDVAVMTNISEAHLEFMKTFDHYLETKFKLLKNQTSKQVAILNKEDNYIKEFSKNINSSIKWYSSSQTLTKSYIKDNYIYYLDEKIIALSDIKIKGVHNYENIMAAIIAAKEFDCDNESIIEVLKSFGGVEHRLELVANKNGVTFYNDTEATNIKCTSIALSAFTEPTILILGGYERNQNFNDLKPFIKNVKAIVAIGQCRARVEQFASENNIKNYSYETLKEGFAKCVEIALKGDIVLLSPASASWDQYEKCEDRGSEFKKYVNEI